MFELGISSNNECGKTIDEVLANVKAAGFTDVMVAFKVGDAEDSIKKALKLNLNIPYVHLVTRYADDLWAKGECNKDYILDVCHQIEICGKYNIPVAVLHATVGDPSNLTLPPSQHAIDSMKEILKAAKTHNVKIALENVDGPNYDKFCYLLDNINSEWLGFCYDAGHHNLYNPTEPILEKYGNRILAVHLHDNLMDWEYGYDHTRDLHMLPFDGKIDFEAIAKKLAQTNYAGPIMLELHKITIGEPRKYLEISNQKFLNQAKERAIKLKQLILKYKQN